MREDLPSEPALNAFNGENTLSRRDYFVQYRRGLRWRLLVAYVSPLLLLSVFFYYHYAATIEDGITNHLKSVAENERNTVDLYLQERVANLASSFRPDNLSIPPAAGEIDRVLQDLRFGSPAFTDLGLFDPAGIMLAYAGPYPHLLGRNYAAETWYRQLLDQNKDFVISDVYLGFRGEPHFIIAVRRRVAGRVWILRASVDPEKFGEFVRSSHLVTEAEAYVINQKGERQTISVREPAAPLHSSFVPQRTPETEVKVAAFGGQDSLYAAAWLTEHDWAVVVRVPSDRAFAPLRRARTVLAGVTLLTLVLIVLFVNRSTRKVVDRLEASDTDKEKLRRQLFHAAKLASVGEMAAGVAHEINNPLAIIHEEASLLKDLMDPQFGQQLKPDEQRERLDAIIQATLRGRTITRNLLAFAREHDPVLESIDINAIIDRVLAIKDLELRVCNIEVRRDFAEQLPVVLGNTNQMEQVLYNLLHNARDAIERDGRITLRTRLQGRFVQVDVEDTGCGMSEEQMEKIFFPFYTTKEVGKGTGLGLSISYGIIKSFGGSIEVKSRLGKGTTFSLRIPVWDRASG
jgi:two-component system NtrC family sensor kinase